MSLSSDRVRADGGQPLAHLGGQLATGLAEVSDDPRVLDGGGRWAVVLTYEGELTCARFTDWRQAPLPPARRWIGPPAGEWTTSLDRAAYIAAVAETRERIAAGTVYQANICRVLSAPLPDGSADLLPLAALLAERHHAPYAGLVRLPEAGVQVATASPELFLRRDGRRVTSSPIKGTGRTVGDLVPKDVAENVMIVDLVRNDLSRVCETGSVAVSDLLAVEKHPGLVHLVSTVTGLLAGGMGWPELLAATFPPGSVTGAPKSTAVRTISELEPVPRGPYCGAVGWVDADTGQAELAVGIRTFWTSGGTLRFGTGAGITWGSDPEREWTETELKAERLVGLASPGAVAKGIR
ncbi:MAG TPA: chorismate-binding protein [Jiangellaceae bacterium]|nr:chorismate-binding protein [Jiangellaceae bacterium]